MAKDKTNAEKIQDKLNSLKVGARAGALAYQDDQYVKDVKAVALARAKVGQEIRAETRKERIAAQIAEKLELATQLAALPASKRQLLEKTPAPKAPKGKSKAPKAETVSPPPAAPVH